MSKVVISYSELSKLILTAGRATEKPQPASVFSWVVLYEENGLVMATATDRYVLAYVRSNTSCKAGFRLPLELQQWTSILATFKPDTGSQLYLTLDSNDTTLRVSTESGDLFAAETIEASYKIPQGEYPKTGHLLSKASSAHPTEDVRLTSFSPRLLKKIPLPDVTDPIVYLSNGPGTPSAFASSWWLFIAMPLRGVDQSMDIIKTWMPTFQEI